MRRPILLPLCAVLCACSQGEAQAPFTDSRIPPALEQRFWPPAGWTWGLIQLSGAPPLRYGVSAPVGVRPKGDVLILGGFGESAEAWFETARALNAAGYVTWVLEGVGQGGSGRFGPVRDILHAPDLDVEPRAVVAMTSVTASPPLVVAQTTAAPSALLAVSQGAQTSGLVLSAPILDVAEPPISAAAAKSAAPTLRRMGMGSLRAIAQPRWRRREPLPKGRAGVIGAWAQANPDLRFGGASWGWIDAFERQVQTLTPDVLKRIQVRVLILEPDARRSSRAEALCGRLSSCVLRPVRDGRGSLHLERDGVYRAWLAALLGQMPATERSGASLDSDS